jgi:Killing trait
MSDTSERGGDAPSAASFRAVVDDLLRLYGTAAGKDGSPVLTDAVTQALLLALGSGLQIAALDAAAAAQRAQAMLFFDAVAQQQRGSIVALEATAKAVREILNAPEDALAAAPESEADNDG